MLFLKRDRLIHLIASALLAFLPSAQSAESPPPPYVFSTFVGQGGFGYQNGVGDQAKFTHPYGLGVDLQNRVIYVTDTWNHVIRRIDAEGTVSLLAGSANHEGSTDGTGSEATFRLPQGQIAIDSTNAIFVTDSGNHIIRRITPTGEVSTFAGKPGSAGSVDGAGTEAQFSFPWGIAIDEEKHLYVADFNTGKIREIDPEQGVSTLGIHAKDAENTTTTFSHPHAVYALPRSPGSSAKIIYVLDDKGLHQIERQEDHSWQSRDIPEFANIESTRQQFWQCFAIAPQGILYWSDSTHHVIRKYDPTLPTPGPVTLAGFDDRRGFQDGANELAEFHYPSCISLDWNGNIVAADYYNHAIRLITPAGNVTTLAGGFAAGASVNGAGRNARFHAPHGVASDPAGNLFVTDSLSHTLRRITPKGAVTTVAGNAAAQGSHQDGVGTKARFQHPTGLAYASQVKELFIADADNSAVRIYAEDGTVTTAFKSDPTISICAGIARSPDGSLFVADYLNHVIRKIEADGTTQIIAGVFGRPYDSTESGSTNLLRFPQGNMKWKDGILYFTDTENHVIRKLESNGAKLKIVAGQLAKPGGDEGGIGEATFNSPFGLDMDDEDNLYVCDFNSGSIRKVTAGGLCSTIAKGTFIRPHAISVITNSIAEKILYVLDDQRLWRLDLNRETGAWSKSAPSQFENIGSSFLDFWAGFAISPAGVLYWSDSPRSVIRRFDPRDPNQGVQILAGSEFKQGEADGVGTNALLRYPHSLVLDSQENLYFTDGSLPRIRKVSSNGSVSTLVTKTAGLSNPEGLAVTGDGLTAFVADTRGHRIARLHRSRNDASWSITFPAGSGSPGSEDGVGALAGLNNPSGIVFSSVEATQLLYIADSGNHCIRRLQKIENSEDWELTTFAGKRRTSGYADGNALSVAQFDRPSGLAVDSVGNVYVTEAGNNTIRLITKESENWVVKTLGGVAQRSILELGEGSGPLSIQAMPGSSDGVGQMARFYSPNGLAMGPNNTLWVADTLNNCIRAGQPISFVAQNSVTLPVSSTQGSLRVDVLPQSASGLWRLRSEREWRRPGEVASELPTGTTHFVEFVSRVGWLTPEPTALAIREGENRFTAYYYPTNTRSTNLATGGIGFTLGSDAPPEAGWEIRDAPEASGGMPYRSDEVAILPSGEYEVAFVPVAGWRWPEPKRVSVVSGITNIFEGAYALATNSLTDLAFPTPVLANQIDESPYQFNGQLVTPEGMGSGFVVSPNVVLTAAHVVFSDSRRDYVRDVFWLLKGRPTSHRLAPKRARGAVLLSGFSARRTYADQRQSELASGVYGEGQASPESANLDVAAIYFLDAPAGGGYGGYLSSDEMPNLWLRSDFSKWMAGFPVDGSMFGHASIDQNAGQMYQIALPETRELIQEPASAYGDRWIYSVARVMNYPGASGGPLYIQYAGSSYPAAVYLGTSFRGDSYFSLFRAIDREVTNLIVRAELFLTQTNQNNQGGVVTLGVSARETTNALYFKFIIDPPVLFEGGRALGGFRWPGDGSIEYRSRTNLFPARSVAPGASFEFLDVPGWDRPATTRLDATNLLGGYTVVSYTPAINDPPEIQAPAVVNLLEDTVGAFTITITDPDLTNRYPDLPVTLSSSDPSILDPAGMRLDRSTDRTSIFLSPNINRSGSVTVSLAVNDGEFETKRDLFVQILPINDTPTLDPLRPDPVELAEDADEQRIALTGISAGGGEDQEFLVTATSSNTGLVADPVSIRYEPKASTGTLVFRPQPNASGTTVITVRVRDDGGTDNGGVDLIERSFTVHVTPQNDAPTITAPLTAVTREDSGFVDVGIDLDDTDSPLESLRLSVSTPANSLIGADGLLLLGEGAHRILRISPRTNATGTAPMVLTARDGEGAESTHTLSLTMEPVNDAPSFKSGPDQIAIADGQPRTVEHWATEIRFGPEDEAGQGGHFLTENDAAALFAAAPTITADGTLSFTPMSGGNGRATVTVRLQDDGGTERGGQDTSAPQSFVITINPPAETPPPILQAEIEAEGDHRFLQLSWPADSGSSFDVQEASALTTNSWVAAQVDAPVAEGGRVRLRLPLGRDAHFYRLIRR